MKSKTGILVALVILLLLGAAAVVVKLRDDGTPAAPVAKVVPKAGRAPNLVAPAGAAGGDHPAVDPLPGQGRVIVERGPGLVAGRVINWSTGDGVEGADLTFLGDGGATTVRTRAGGAFEPAHRAGSRSARSRRPGSCRTRPSCCTRACTSTCSRAARCAALTVFLFPALDYYGRVVDAKGAPVPGAKVRLLGTPTNEQAIDKLETEWTTDKTGKFVFHAADDAVFEASRGKERGWARLDGDVMNTKQLDDHDRRRAGTRPDDSAVG